MSNGNRVFMGATAGLLLLVAPGAFAQQSAAPQAAADELDTIVVTARKRAESLLEVPVAVTVATQEQLERDQIYNYTDLARVAPALEISQTSGGENNGGARLRGLGTGVFNFSVSPSVAFVVDQVPQGNLAFPQLFDLAQVEVLRGPQGTLFGQGASAGVINVATAAPTTDALKGSAGIDYANDGTAGSEYGQRVLRGMVNIPLGDRAALRVAAQRKQELGLQRNVTLGQDHDIVDTGVRAKMMFKAGDNVTVNLSLERNVNDQDGFNFFSIAIAPTGRPNSAASLGAFTSPTGPCKQTIDPRASEYCSETRAHLAGEANSASAIVDIDLGAATLTSVTALRSLERRTDAVDFSRLASTPSARNENILQKSDQFSQELRLSYTGERMDLVAGGYYSEYEFDQLPLVSGAFSQTAPGKRIGFSVCVNGGFFCVVPVDFTRDATTNYIGALFADGTFKASDTVDVFGGVRYSDYSNKSGIGIDTLTPTREVKIGDSNMSGRLGLRVRPDANTTYFASLSKGYKPPAVVVPATPAQPVVNLKPEVATAFDLGAKLAYERLQLEANVFYTEVEDFQAQTSVFVGTALVSQALNIASVKSKGIELTAFGQLTDSLTVNGGYQFNDIKYPSGYLGDDGGALGGTQFLNAPKHKFTLSGEYSRAFGTGMEFFANANVVYKSETLLAARSDPRYRYPAHEIIGGAVGLRDDGGVWRASLFVRNLTKEREPTAYLASTFQGAPDGGLRAWPVGGLTARQVGLSVDMNF